MDGHYIPNAEGLQIFKLDGVLKPLPYRQIFGFSRKKNHVKCHVI